MCLLPPPRRSAESFCCPLGGIPAGKAPGKFEAAMNPENAWAARSFEASVGQKSTSLPLPSDVCPRPSQRSPIFTVRWGVTLRSEEHTSELQSQSNLVCRLLLAKKKTR